MISIVIWLFIQHIFIKYLLCTELGATEIVKIELVMKPVKTQLHRVKTCIEITKIQAIKLFPPLI